MQEVSTHFDSLQFLVRKRRLSRREVLYLVSRAMPLPGKNDLEV